MMVLEDVSAVGRKAACQVANRTVQRPEPIGLYAWKKHPLPVLPVPAEHYVEEVQFLQTKLNLQMVASRLPTTRTRTRSQTTLFDKQHCLTYFCCYTGN